MSGDMLEQLMSMRGEDFDEKEDLDAATDPINQINVVEYLTQCLASFAAHDGALFGQYFAGLTQKQQQAVHSILPA
eukprot:gene14421-17051_t